MSDDVVLGIDLGTTNSVVAVSDGGQARVLSNELGQRLVPSVVSFKPGGGVLVGEEARERRLLDAANTIYSVKRLIGRPYRSPEVRMAQERFAFEIRESPTGGVVVGIRGETYTLTEISAFVLREVARVAELSVGKSTRAVITVPANFNELQRSATKAAGRVAGLEVLRIINEPTAAALAYGYGKQKPERVAVFDLGGGTFDITILDLENDVFEVIATAGDSFLGGDDVDLLIAEMMCDTFLKQHRWDPRTDRQAYERLRAAAEWAKCQLSVDQAVELTVEELHYGAGGKRLDLEFELDRANLERSVMPLLARSFDVCNDAFKEAGMKPGQVDSVVMVGGSTRIPLVRKMVVEYFQKEPRDEIDADLVVAQGAAIHGFAVGGSARKRTRSLGRVALKKVSSQELQKLAQARKDRQKDLPRQPAFAPTDQVDKPAAPKRPAPLGRPAREAAPIPEMPTRAVAPPLPPAPTRAVQAPGPPPIAPPPIAAQPPVPPRATPKRTQLGMPITPPPAHLRRADDSDFEEETVTKVTGDELIAAAKALHEEGGVESHGLDMGDFGEGDRAFFDLNSEAPPTVSELPGLEFDEDTTSIPGVVAVPAVRVGANRTDHSQVGIQLEGFLSESQVGPAPRPPAPPPPLRPQVTTQEGPFGHAPLDDAPTSVRPSPFASPPAAPPAPPAMPEPPPAPAATEQHVPAFEIPNASEFPSMIPKPIVDMVDRAPPLLMDVTPHSLGIETAGGFCQHLIRRNAPIPAEQVRVFSTASDNQQVVSIRVCQGEEREFGGNQLLGEVELTGLRAALRGHVQINVAFQLDASGTLDVRAVDTDTGKEQTIRINLLGGASEADIAAMRSRQQGLLG